jgi:hypothetical protein
MDGDANQKAIIGAIGTPLNNMDAIIGTTEHEQNGAIAPTKVAISMDTPIFFLSRVLILLETPISLIIRDRGIVTSNSGQMWINASVTNVMILVISVIMIIPPSFNRKNTIIRVKFKESYASFPISLW